MMREQQNFERKSKRKILVSIIVLLLVCEVTILAADRFLSYSFNTTEKFLNVYDGIMFVSHVKEAIEAEHKKTGRCPRDNVAVGLPNPENIRSKYVKSVTVSCIDGHCGVGNEKAACRITIEFNERVRDGARIFLDSVAPRPGEELHLWRCRPADTHRLPKSWLPSECREEREET